MRDRLNVLVCALALVLSLATVFAQYRDFATHSPDGNPRIGVGVGQVERNDEVLRGEGGDPWQFRVASAWLAEQAHRAAEAAGFAEPGLVGFLGFRVLQNMTIFLLAWLLYRRLGATPYVAAIGLCLAGWGMTQVFHNSGLSFDTYGDVIVYLVAALLILDRRYAWIVPLAVIGALNRETSGLVPVMLIATGIRLGVRTDEGRRAALLGAAAFAAFAVTTVVLRTVVGPGEVIHAHGKDFGWEIFEFNVGRGLTWDNVFQMVTVVPLLAAASWRHWPPALRTFGIVIVPAWLAIHFFAAVVAETRLLLVPYLVVLIPGALAGLAGRSGDEARGPGDDPAKDRLEARADALARA